MDAVADWTFNCAFPSYWEVTTINWSFFRSKRDAVDLRKCLPIAVREINNDQLIFLHIKRCGWSSKMPSYRCEKHQQWTDLFADQKVMQWVFKSAFLSLWEKLTRINWSFSTSKDAVDLQKCLPIAVKEIYNWCFCTSKRDAVRGVQCFIR